jgi:hypothetical protein
MPIPSGDAESAETEEPVDPVPSAPRVRRHAGVDEPAGRWATPDSERDEIWGDTPPDAAERLRREVPPHHGG